MSRMKDKLGLKPRMRASSPEKPQAWSMASSPSFRDSKASPEMVGWLQYRSPKSAFWRKAYFRIHSHYLSFVSKEEKESRGAINLWNVAEIVLDNDEIRMTLNEKALKRNGIRSFLEALPTKGDPVFRLKASTAVEASRWVDAMRNSGVKNDMKEPGSSVSSSVRGWALHSIELVESSGNVLHSIQTAIPSGTRVRLLLGNRVSTNAELEVLVKMRHLTSPAALASGSQPLRPADRHGNLNIAVPLPTGESAYVRLSWQADTSDDDDLVPRSSPVQQISIIATVALLSSLVSMLLFFVVSAGGAYWLCQFPAQPRQQADVFLTEVTMSEEAVFTPTSRRSIAASLPGAEASGDLSISAREAAKLTQLRVLLEDLKGPGSGVSAAVFERHVNKDYRLVRFLRARPTLEAAAEMVRESLKWRTESKADEILDTFTPPPWVFEYLGTPSFVECLQNGTDRRKCYQRDKKGHLTVYWRGGFVDFKNLFAAVHGDIDYAMKVLVWTFEILRYDLEKLHEETNGAVPSYITLVYDLEGFEFANQVPVSTALPVAQRFFNMLNVNYPETIHRILIIRTPWLFYSLWSVFKPLIPQDLLEKMPLTGGGKVAKVLGNITPTIAESFIPRFLGGTMVDEGGDEECRHSVGPCGPFLPDKGKGILARTAAGPPPPK